MLSIRAILAVLLLFCYSVGMAHDFIPHCHDVKEEHHHSAHGHDHEPLLVDHEHHNDHQHFPHQNHLDEGLIGLLSCLLGEANHPIDASSQRCLPGQLSTFNAKKPVFVLLFFQVVTNATLKDLEKPTYLTTHYLLPQPLCEVIGTVSHRGPPTFLS